MATKPIAGFHLIRFGTAADQQFLLAEFLPTYDQLIINANMVAHMPSALASLLSIRAKNKPYFIDPQTHAFQHNISYIESDSENRGGAIKKSLQKLMEAFGNPVTSSVGKEHRPLSPSDFTSKAIIDGFCERVLKFQAQAIAKEANQSEAAKYYKYLNKFYKRQEKTENLFSPTMVIAPYFYLTPNTFKDWLPINIKCATASKKIAGEIKLPLGVQIVASKELLVDSVQIQELITQYIAIKPDVFLIWVDSFAEQDASEQELNDFISLCEELGKISPVINLYGGFFSVALRHCDILKNLIGVAHGLEYGESRGVVPVGGGIPTAKFYFPALNTRLLFRDALRAVRAVGGHKSVDDFHKKVCDCKTCREEITSNPETDFEKYGKARPIRFMRSGQSIAMGYPLPETKERTVKHYLWCKKNEYGYQCSPDDLVRRLGEIKSKLEKTLDLENLSHCDLWAKIIKNRKSKV